MNSINTFPGFVNRCAARMRGLDKAPGLRHHYANGGLFTFLERFTPDYRNWSGGDFTAQNQRLVYWPKLKSATGM